MTANAILECVERHARQRHTTVALRDPFNSPIAYGALWDAVRQLADTLSETGARRVLLDADNGIPWAIADLAAMFQGLTLTPIPGFFSERQVAHIARVTDADVVLASPEQAGRWEQDPLWRREHLDGALVLFRRLAGGACGADATPFAGKVTFTSGSTGNPRGVLLDNDTIAATSSAIVESLADLQPREHLGVLPLATLLENIAGLYAPLMNGSAVHLPDRRRTGLDGASLDVESFRALLASTAADTMILVPQLLTAVVSLVELGLLSLPSFRLIAVGGGRVSRALLDRCAAAGLPVFEGYGLSECCSVLTLNLPGDNRPGSVGRPLSHADIRISDSSEIEVRKPVMNGYLDGDSGMPPSPWYGTGDVGRFDDEGYLYIEGRRRNVFITSYGRNVNPEWPEAALTQHAALAQALVTGEGRDHNLGLIWPRFAMDDDAIQLIVDKANAELPAYAQVHRWIRLTTPLDATLQTANGRLRREAALRHYAALIDGHYDSPLSATPISDSARSEHAVL